MSGPWLELRLSSLLVSAFAHRVILLHTTTIFETRTLTFTWHSLHLVLLANMPRYLPLYLPANGLARPCQQTQLCDKVLMLVKRTLSPLSYLPGPCSLSELGTKCTYQDLLMLLLYLIASKMDYAWSGLDGVIVQKLGINLYKRKTSPLWAIKNTTLKMLFLVWAVFSLGHCKHMQCPDSGYSCQQDGLWVPNFICVHMCVRVCVSLSLFLCVCVCVHLPVKARRSQIPLELEFQA